MRVPRLLLLLTVLALSSCSRGAPAWTRVPHDEAVLGGPGDQAIFQVAVGGPGLVAVGRDLMDDDGDAAVWVSADGYDWNRVPDDGAVFGGPEYQAMRGVTAGGPGLVAVGADDARGNRDAAVWVSADGYSWTRLPHDELVFGGAQSQEMTEVIAAGPGLVAVGYSYSHGEQDAAIWVSRTGYDWVRITDETVFGGPGDQGVRSVTAGGPGLVAVGHDTSDDTGVQQWATVWVSPDGYTWTRIKDEGVFGASLGGLLGIASVTAGGPGLVAVGRTFSGDAEDAAVWVSADGYTWSRVNDDDGLGGAGSQEMWQVIQGGPGLVGVGFDYREDYRTAVWVSTDGYTWSRALFGGTGQEKILTVTAGGPGLVGAGTVSSWSDLDAAIWVSDLGQTRPGG